MNTEPRYLVKMRIIDKGNLWGFIFYDACLKKEKIVPKKQVINQIMISPQSLNITYRSDRFYFNDRNRNITDLPDISLSKCNKIIKRNSFNIKTFKNTQEIGQTNLRNTIKSRKDDVIMTNNTIVFDGKSYECKRYSYDELKMMFDGKVVVLEDPVYKDMNLVSGVLLEVCNIKEKKNLRLKYLKSSDKNFTFWDFSQTPLLISYQEVM